MMTVTLQVIVRFKTYPILTLISLHSTHGMKNHEQSRSWHEEPRAEPLMGEWSIRERSIWHAQNDLKHRFRIHKLHAQDKARSLLFCFSYDDGKEPIEKLIEHIKFPW